MGAIADSWAMLVTARSFSVSAVKAEIAIGTSCTFSDRFCAVTTISGMPLLVSTWAGSAWGGVAGAVCACASDGRMTVVPNRMPMIDVRKLSSPEPGRFERSEEA